MQRCSKDIYFSVILFILSLVQKVYEIIVMYIKEVVEF